MLSQLACGKLEVTRTYEPDRNLVAELANEYDGTAVARIHVADGWYHVTARRHGARGV